MDMEPTPNRMTYLAVALAIVTTGLLVRWPALGVPCMAAKYAGSILWGAMVYTLVRAINPHAVLLASVAVACSIAACVEFSRLYHTPALDSFRTTLAGQLLLGRVFSVWNLAAYGVGIGASAAVDSWRR